MGDIANSGSGYIFNDSHSDATCRRLWQKILVHNDVIEASTEDALAFKLSELGEALVRGHQLLGQAESLLTPRDVPGAT